MGDGGRLAIDGLKNHVSPRRTFSNRGTKDFTKEILAKAFYFFILFAVDECVATQNEVIEGTSIDNFSSHGSNQVGTRMILTVFSATLYKCSGYKSLSEYSRMKVSLRATYGIIAAVDLALHDRDVPVQARTIARRQGIPARFLEQVLHAMKKAGLVVSHRGAQGGYALNRKPQDLSLASILEVLEGPLTETNGRERRIPGARVQRQDALLAHVWDRIKQAELNILAEITVDQLANRQRQLEQQRSLMYHI